MTPILDMPTAYRWIITLAFMLVIIILSVTPDRGQPGDSVFAWLVVKTAPPLQKLLHVGCYAAIAALWMWTLEALEPPLLRIGLALLLSIGLGAGLEWYQTQVPGRFGTIADVLLNAAGAIAGMLFALLLL